MRQSIEHGSGLYARSGTPSGPRSECTLISSLKHAVCFSIALIALSLFARGAHADVKAVEYHGGAFVEISPSEWIEVKRSDDSDAIWGLYARFLHIGPGIPGVPDHVMAYVRAGDTKVLWDLHRNVFVILALFADQVLYATHTQQVHKIYDIISTNSSPNVSGSSIDWTGLITFAEHREHVKCGQHVQLFNISTRTYYGVPVSGSYYYPSPESDRANADAIRFSCTGPGSGILQEAKYNIRTAYTSNWPHDWIRYNWLGAFSHGVGYYLPGYDIAGETDGSGYGEQYEWEIVLDGRGGLVAFGDKITLRNVYYDQFLVPDTSSEVLWTESREHRTSAVEPYDWIILPADTLRTDLLDSRRPGESAIEACYDTCDDILADAARGCAQEGEFCPAAATHLGCVVGCEFKDAIGDAIGPIISPDTPIPIPCPGGGGDSYCW